MNPIIHRPCSHDRVWLPAPKHGAGVYVCRAFMDRHPEQGTRSSHLSTPECTTASRVHGAGGDSLSPARCSEDGIARARSRSYRLYARLFEDRRYRACTEQVTV